VRFAVDADPVGRDGSGNETYLRGILGPLPPRLADGEDAVLFGSRPAALAELAGPGVSVVASPPGVPGDLALGPLMRRSRPSAVLAHYNLPLLVGAPVATIVHDVAFLRLPRSFPPALRWRLRASVRRSVRGSAAVVTVSEFSRAELLDCYPDLHPASVVVAANAPRAAFFAPIEPEALAAVRAHHRLPSEFVLAVGNIQPRKNLSRLVEAAGRLEVPVVLAGRVLHAGPGSVPASATWLGRVSDADLAALYRLSSVFAYVSLYEGFGLPVVEALATGAVVVTSNGSGMAEVAGGAAVGVDPTSLESITAGLEQGLHDSDLRARLAAAGPVRAAAYSWEASCSTVLTTLREIAG
jgi:glycosyltransferase involved in cell wall biosynthesis